MSYADRIARLRASFDTAKIDACLISQPESRYYLSGYSGSDLPPRDSAGYLLISRDQALLLTDPRTTEKAAKEASLYEISTRAAGMAGPQALANAISGLGVRRVGFESVHLPYGVWAQMRSSIPAATTLVPAGGLVEDLRIIKDSQELAELQQAVDVLDRCLAYVLDHLEAGLTERQVARMVDLYLIEHADGSSFPAIVASGPNGSIPHANPTDRRIRTGEPITIDIGARVNGYCSDMTRTVCLGQPNDARMTAIYEVVLEAQRRAAETVRPGMTGREADALARDVIVLAGYGEAFIHGTGHGIGLEVHEPPWVSQSGPAENVLRPGMVFSIEPGIYLPGWGGVRIEDLVVLQPDGARVLCTSPKDFVVSNSPRAQDSAALLAGGNT